MTIIEPTREIKTESELVEKVRNYLGQSKTEYVTFVIRPNVPDTADVRAYESTKGLIMQSIVTCINFELTPKLIKERQFSREGLLGVIEVKKDLLKKALLKFSGVDVGSKLELENNSLFDKRFIFITLNKNGKTERVDIIENIAGAIEEVDTRK